jgi:hypothetical protein
LAAALLLMSGLGATSRAEVRVGAAEGLDTVIVEVRVAASSDDAEESATGQVDLASTDLELVFDRSIQTVGMRFNGIELPPGAAIVNAYLQFQVDEATSGATSLTISGQDVDHAATFVSSNGDISSRPRTAATVSWSPVPWPIRGEAGPDQRSPNIASVIQEIVDRQPVGDQTGWVSGNSLAIIITGTGERVAESYDGVPAAAALLHVEYGAGQPPVVTINTPPDGASLNAGEGITFSGSAADAEDGDLTANLSWVSSLDGTIGTGGSFTRSDLSVGTHTITASVTDSSGLTATDAITITIDGVVVYGIVVLPTSLTISEPSGSDVFVLTLTSRPSAMVSVDLSAMGDQCTVSPASLELDADNWASGATATVTAVDDSVADGPQICMVLTDPAISGDPGYAGQDPDDVTVTVYDNEVPSIVASPASLTIDELDGSDTFALTLTTPPSDKVSIPLSAMGDECTVSPASVDLDAANWSSGVVATVTAVDDDTDDGPQPCVVRSGPAISADPVYHGRRGNNVTVTVVDDDEAGIEALPTGLFIAEPFGSDTFVVRLTSEPLGTVSVDLLAMSEQCTVLPASASLDAGNWSSGVVATVTAVDDDIADGPQTCLVHTGPANSSDSQYQGLSGANITVIVDDDDQAGIDVSDTSLSVREPAGTDTFTLRLTSQPTATVSVSLSAVGDQCTVSPASADLDAANWSGGVVATVTAVDDDIEDGIQICVVHTGPAGSTDTLYQGLNGADVSVTVRDNDTAGITVDTSGLGPISEPDGSVTFTLKLNSQPTATVSVDLSTAGEQCTVSPASVDLDAGNWSSGVVATVTAVDDDIDDGTQPCQVQTTRTSSGDPKYDELLVDDVLVSVHDDDEAGIDVLPTDLAIGEPDGSDTFTLKLTSQPTAKVSVGLSASGGECTVLPASVDLDTENWADGATATVTAVDDDLEDGTQTCMVLTGSASSADPKYQNHSVADVTVTVRDDDTVYRAYVPLVDRRWPPVPDVPTLSAIQNADGDGTFTVSWSPGSQPGVTYILEESTDSTFSDVSATYSTGSTSYGLSEQEAGRYYYRVKARNSWGDSGWSTVQRVDVLWHWEGNDEPGDNGPVASGKTYFGILPSASDERDYFYFDLVSPHQVELRLTHIAAGQNYDLALRDVNLDTFPGWYSVQPGHSNEHVLTGVLPAGTYYIQVYRNPDSSGGSSQAYHLWVVYE